ncbi:hypothetical protein [Microbacterium sp. CJ88]|uniref:hypothetical protein n=1 Tax=Microbacterium sp. CJ88 TaxID=3445672 RepID=UPI003F656160
MLRFVVSAGLLASAFSPVAVVLAVVVHPFPDVWANVVLAVALALPLGLLPLVWWRAQRLGEARLRPAKVRRRDADNLALLSSNVLPLTVAFFAPDDARTPASVVVLVILMLLYVRGGLQYLNPVLVVIGVHLYAVELDNGVEVWVLSRRSRLPQTEPIDAVQYSDHIYLERRAHVAR